MKFIKDWLRRRRIKTGRLRWARLRYTDVNIRIAKDKPLLILKRTVVQFHDGTIRHDVTLRSISMGGYSYDHRITGASAGEYKSMISSLRRSFNPEQFVVLKTIDHDYRQNVNSELWRVKGTKYRGPYWELRSWELKGKSYVLKTNASQDVHKLLMLAPNIGDGLLLQFGQHVIPKTQEDIMMFILSSSEELATMS